VVQVYAENIDYTRHPGDLVRLAIGAVLLAACSIVAALTRITTFETSLFHLVNSLPGWLYRFLWLIMQLGTFGAIFVLAGIAVVTRRVRLALELVGAGLAAYYSAIGLKDLVERHRPEALLSGVVIHGTAAKGLGYPSGHAAVATALAATAVPFLTRRWRRWIWLLPITVCLARVFVGAHLPLDVAGGFVLGWTVGAAVHLAGGSPSGRVTDPDVRHALSRAGVEVADVRPAIVDARGSTPFFAQSTDGSWLFVKAVGADQRDADLLFKLFRFVAYRNLDDERPFTSAKRQLEREALVDLLVAKANVRTPAVLAITTLENGTTLLAHQGLDATGLDTVDPDRLTDEVLESLWRQVAVLHCARIAHRDLRLANVMIDVDDEPWLVDFGFAQTSATDRALVRDVAEMLASQASVVTPDRAVKSAITGIGAVPVQQALPYLTPASLARATRTSLMALPRRLEDLREEAAEQLGSSLPPVARLGRWQLGRDPAESA
jgi:undecaprenyl-diphosphatase